MAASAKTNGDSSHTASTEDEYVVVSKEDLWKDALELSVGDATIQLVGLDDQSNHIVYARVSKDEGSNGVSIGTVVEAMVDEGWRRIIKDILEKKQHVQVDSHPPASLLLRLGAVWLLNETAWQKGEGSHAHRLTPKDEDRVPDWKDMTLRVYYVPDRFFVADTVDWSKPCRGLLIGPTTTVKIGDETPHVSVMEGLPDIKDGVIVYEDDNHGFAVLNKPGAMPDHATISNNAEDVVSCYQHALEERKGAKQHVVVPQRLDGSLDTATAGLLAVATNTQFSGYLNKLLNKHQVKRHFKALICIKNPESISQLEHFQSAGTIVTHYLDPKSPTPKRFYRHKPKDSSKKHLVECKLKILKIGDDNFRAACVRSVYKDSVDSSLAHRLWGPDSATPGEDLGVQYVMEVEVELLTAKPQQIRGQLAALGCPIVGDVQYGGGKCELHSQKHAWNRLALQCCELSFKEPQWKDEGNKELVPSERDCFFRLDNAWWSDYLTQYEQFHQSY